MDFLTLPLPANAVVRWRSFRTTPGPSHHASEPGGSRPWDRLRQAKLSFQTDVSIAEALQKSHPLPVLAPLRPAASSQPDLQVQHPSPASLDGFVSTESDTPELWVFAACDPANEAPALKLAALAWPGLEGEPQTRHPV